jgi:hypothetical protein
MKLGGSLGNVPSDSPNFIKLLWICSIKYHHQHPLLLYHTSLYYYEKTQTGNLDYSDNGCIILMMH